MTQTLMTLLCIEHQRGDAGGRPSSKESFYTVLELHGGKLVSSTGASFDIFLFESPTEAVLAGTEILEGEQSIFLDKIRIIVHTTEITTSLSTLDQELLNVVTELLSRATWGDLVISDSTYGSIKHSEISRVCESTSWQLKTDRRNHQMYRVKIKAEASEVRSERQQRSADLQALRRGAKNAPYDRRTLAFMFDYLMAVIILGMFSVVNRLPEFWRVYTSRIIIEFEDFDVENVRKDLSWKAYGGELASVGYLGKLSKRVFVPKGNYDVDLIYIEGTPEVQFNLKIGGFTKEGMPTVSPVEDSLMTSKLRIIENLPLEGDVDLIFEGLGRNGDMVGLDALVLTPVGKDYHDGKRSLYFYYGNRYEDLLRILGCWDLYNNDVKYIFFFVFRCYPLWLLINIIFLTLCTWTPGGLLLKSRIVTMKGERPGFVRALVRAIAALLGWFTFGYGWFKPLISHDERTWSDAWSHTRLIILE